MGEASAFYNEWDSYAADWLRNLCAAGHIAPGVVDSRSIRDVRPVDLDGYTRVHFFAGIGGWDLALQLAGWPDDVPVWTGSCPCQPFSAAGKRGGFDDDRHLWPEFFRLIGECRPGFVMGEQVASRDGLAWLDLVHTDLEGAGYAIWAADLCAAGVGAPHIRQRLWWVGVADAEEQSSGRPGDSRSKSEARCGRPIAGGRGAFSLLADSFGSRLEGRDARPLGHKREAAERSGATSGLGDANRDGSQSWDGAPSPAGHGHSAVATGVGPWSDVDWLPCRDGKARPTRPGLFPLAHGVSARVGKLRAAGNAIVPQVGAAFIRAVMASLAFPQPRRAETGEPTP